MTRWPRRIALAGAVVLVFAFGWFIWPTPYRYIPVASGGALAASDQLKIIAVRVNRFTGRTDFLISVGWVRASQ